MQSRLNESGGDLVLKFAAGEITQRLPVVYQKRPSGERSRCRPLIEWPPTAASA